MKRIISICCLVAVWMLFAAAWTRAQGENKVPQPLIREVKFTGLTHALPELQHARQLIGKPYTEKVAEDEGKALFDLGYFTQVNFDTKEVTNGIVINFQVIENPPVLSISFEGKKLTFGNDLLREIERIIAPIDGQPFSKKALDKTKDELMGLGIYVKIDAGVSDFPDGKAVKFTVQLNPEITGIAFAGNSIIPAEELQKLLPFKAGQVLNRNQVRVAAEAINKTYQERGYILCGVTDFGVNTDGGIQFTIHEPKISEIRITGNKRVSEQVLRDALTCHVGDIFNVKAIETSIEQVKKIPGIRLLEVSNEPGATPATRVVIIKISENTDQAK